MVRRYFDHHVGRDSAALTYYLLFALFPLLIFLSNLVGIMSVDISGFLHEIRAFIPQEALEIIERRPRFEPAAFVVLTDFFHLLSLPRGKLSDGFGPPGLR